MKKTLFTIAAALAVTANLSAQTAITLNQSSYSSNNLGTDTLSIIDSTFPNLTPATNAMWDLTTASYDTAHITQSRVATTLLTAQFADSMSQGFGPINYNIDVLTSITSNGIIEYGAYVPQQMFSPGGGASITVDSQVITYSTPQTIIQFPATIGSTWSANYDYKFNFHITANPIYSDAPGIIHAFISEKDSVTGWGKMRVKDLNGNPSGYLDVLQVQSSAQIIDSFFINGTAPIPQLLAGFGLTDPDTSYNFTQFYYRPMEVGALATVYYTDNTFTQPSNATTQTQRLVNESVAVVNDGIAVSVYPNPVTNRTISVDIPTMQGNNWTYDLINVTGQTVATAPLNGSHSQIAVAPSLASGIYYLRINQDGKSVSVKALDINN